MRSNSRRLAAALLASLLLLVLPLVPARATTSPTPAANPDLATSCGTDVTLILDRSGSIGSNRTLVQQAAQTFVDALVGTGSRVQVISFADRATAEPGGGTDLADLAFNDPADLTIPLFASSGSTNWDDALELARRSPAGHAPLVVMVTDGDPTRRNESQPDGHGGTLAGSGSSTSQADLDAAVTEANLLKTLPGHPGHVFAVGVGSAVTDSDSEERLVAISGPDELTFSGGNPNIPFGTADYTLVNEFSALKTTVSRFVRELCGPSLNVVKKLQRADGTTVDATAADPFTFTASLNPVPSIWRQPVQAPAATASLTTTDGVANFSWEPSTPDASTTITLTEDAKAGWVYNGEKCWVNNLDGTPAVLVKDNVGANAVGASKASNPLVLPPLGPYQAMNCEIYNRQVRTATVSVDKVTAPTSRPESFSFALKQGPTTVATIPALTDAGNAASFGQVAPGTYDVVEGPAPLFDQTSATCDNLATPAKEQLSATGLVVAEATNWQCTFTNTVHNGTITVVKDLVDAPAATFGFTSTIPGHAAFELSPTGTTNASTSFSVPPGTYAVAESGHAPYALNATCNNGSTPAAIVVTPDATTTCTFTNTAPDPTITVDKAASVPTVPEPGGDVSYTVTVTNTSVEPLTITEISDVVGGSTIDVLALPPDRTTCGPLGGSVLAAGASAVCTFLAPATGNAGTTVTDTVTVRAVDSDQHDASDSDDASVRIVDVVPTLLLTKSTATPTIPEPGADVTFDVSITNTSSEAVELLTLTDQVGAGPIVPLTAVGPVITQTTCTLGSLAAGATKVCSFTTNVSGNAGAAIVDVVRASAQDDDGSVAIANDDATVTLTDVVPSIAVTKVADPISVPEPGGDVTYTVQITNLTAEPVTIDGITDAVGGGAPFAAPGTCLAKVGTTLAGNGSTSCSFTLPVEGDASDGDVVDIATVSASDDEGHDLEVSATATVEVTDVAPTFTLTKVASPTSVLEPSGMVTFTLTIQNTSPESVTIDSLIDVVEGGAPIDLAGVAGTCSDKLGTSLASGASTTCTFELLVSGNGGDLIDDVVTASVGDDDGNQATRTASARVTVTDRLPSVTVTKTPSVQSVPEPGAAVTYEVVVDNTSAEPVTVTGLTDLVGGGTPFDVSDVAGTSCVLPQALAVNGSYSCSFTLTVAGPAGSTVSDTVTATVEDDEGNEATDDATAEVDVTDVEPTITVTKTASAASVPEPGAPVTYTVNIHNTSVEAVTLTGLVDEVGSDPAIEVADLPGTTCALGTEIAAGATVSCTFVLEVAGDAGATVVDTVTATVVDDEQNQASDAASATVGIDDVLPQITVTKVADPTTVAEPGSPVSYTVSVHNASAEAVALTELSDVVGSEPAIDVADIDGTTCALPTTIAVGGTYDCTFTLEVSGDAGDDITDVITATAVDNEDNSTTASATATVAVSDVLPGITVTKVAGSPTVPEPGAAVSYTVTVHNTSVEPVTVTDLTDVVGDDPGIDVTAIAGTDCVLPAPIAVDGSYTCTFTLVVAGNAGAAVADTITATAVDNDGNPTSATATATVAVTDVLPTVTVTKSASTSTVPEPGADVTFTVTVENTSVEPVTLTSLTDLVGEGPAIDVADLSSTTCAVPTAIAIGATYECTFTVPVDGNAGDVVTDTVTATVVDDEQNPANGSASLAIEVTDVAPEIAVTKDASAASVDEPGATVTYTVTVQNTSVEPVTVTSLSDVVGSGDPIDVTGVEDTTCELPQALAVDGTYVCTFTMLVTGNAADQVADTVTATAVDDEENTVTANGSETVGITDVAPTIEVTKTASTPTVAEPGASVTYTVSVLNTSVEAVTLTGLSDVIGADPAFDVSEVLGTTCVLPTVIAVDATYSCTFDAPANGNADDAVTDTVTATATDDDGNTVTDDGSATVGVLDVLPSIVVTKTAITPTVAAPGGPATYEVTVTNTSPEPVTIDAITDALGDETEVDVTTVTAPVTATTCTTGSVLAPAGAEGDSYTCQFTIALVGNDAATLADVVTVVATDDEDNEATDDDTADTELTAVADLAITKVPTVIPTVGQTGVYTFTVTSVGPSAATDVTVTDELPDSLTATSAVGDGWTCVISEAGSVVTCTRPSLASGATASITVGVNVTDPGGGAPIVNTVTVTSPTPDPDLDNNSDTNSVQPVVVLGNVVVAPSNLPQTGTELRGWLVLADLFLLAGAAFLLAEATGLRGRRSISR